MSGSESTTAPALAVELELPAHPRSASRARAELAAFEAYAHPETIAKARLLVTELVAAAVAGVARRPIELRLTVTDGRMRGEVGRVQPVASRPQGWGLLLVQRIADEWGVLADGSVWFEVGRRRRFARDGDGAPPA